MAERTPLKTELPPPTVVGCGSAAYWEYLVITFRCKFISRVAAPQWLKHNTTISSNKE